MEKPKIAQASSIKVKDTFVCKLEYNGEEDYDSTDSGKDVDNRINLSPMLNEIRTE